MSGLVADKLSGLKSPMDVTYETDVNAIQKMRFKEAYKGWQEVVLSQQEAKWISGIYEQRFR